MPEFTDKQFKRFEIQQLLAENFDQSFTRRLTELRLNYRKRQNSTRAATPSKAKPEKGDPKSSDSSSEEELQTIQTKDDAKVLPAKESEILHAKCVNLLQYVRFDWTEN